MKLDKDETLLVKTPIFDLVKVDGSKTLGFDPIRVKAPSWVTIIIKKGHKLLLTKQLRCGTMLHVEEFCAGTIEKGEPPIDAATRELEEETGIKTTKLRYLGCFPTNPAFMNNFMYYYYIDLDTDEFTMVDRHLDDHEKIDLVWKPIYDLTITKLTPVTLLSGLFLLTISGILDLSSLKIRM